MTMIVMINFRYIVIHFCFFLIVCGFPPFFGVAKAKPSKYVTSSIFGKSLYKYEEKVFLLTLTWTFNFIIT